MHVAEICGVIGHVLRMDSLWPGGVTRPGSTVRLAQVASVRLVSGRAYCCDITVTCPRQSTDAASAFQDCRAQPYYLAPESWICESTEMLKLVEEIKGFNLLLRELRHGRSEVSGPALEGLGRLHEPPLQQGL